MRTWNMKMGWFAALVALAAACGSPNGASPSTTADSGTTTDPLSIEVDCSPAVAERGFFEPSCQYVGASDMTLHCAHVSEPGSGGMIVVRVHKPEQIAIGSPTPIGGADPVITFDIASTSVRENTVVQIDGGSVEGAIVFSALERGRIMRGRFLGVAFQTSMQSHGYGCRVSDHDFVADQGPGVTGH